MAAQLEKELGVSADLVAGDAGEFTVWVDDAKVVEKRWGRFPDPREIVAAVRALAT